MDSGEHPDFIETYKWDEELLDYILVKRVPYEEWLAKKQARQEKARQTRERKKREGKAGAGGC